MNISVSCRQDDIGREREGASYLTHKTTFVALFLYKKNAYNIFEIDKRSPDIELCLY